MGVGEADLGVAAVDTERTFEIPPPEVLEVEMPSMFSSMTCMILAPSGYHEPPDGPETMRTNVSAWTGTLASASAAAGKANLMSEFMCSSLGDFFTKSYRLAGACPWDRGLSVQGLALARPLGYIACMDGSRDSGRPALRFRKMHGLGNDFVIIDQRVSQTPLTAQTVRAIGDRHRGVGFDQLGEIYPGTGGAAADVVFWNADGSPSEACGNATRCIADLVMAEAGSDRVDLRSGRGPLRCARRDDGLIEVDMGPPSLGWQDIPLARAADTEHLPIEGDPAACSMGNPHTTFFVDDAEAVALDERGPAVEHDPLFPARTNVQFAQVIDRGRARMRVWERGVGVTLASGSSSCATVVNAVRRGLLDRTATVHLDGGDLHIHWREADGHVLMAGPIAYVFDGAFDLSFVSP